MPFRYLRYLFFFTKNLYRSKVIDSLLNNETFFQVHGSINSERGVQAVFLQKDVMSTVKPSFRIQIFT